MTPTVDLGLSNTEALDKLTTRELCYMLQDTCNCYRNVHRRYIMYYIKVGIFALRQTSNFGGMLLFSPL